MRQGQFSPKQKPVNLILLIKSTVEELKIVQRNGVELVTDFPNQERAMTLGDWELLKKAFTNILLNAIQSLPDGKGRIEILVSPKDGQISTAIVDSGCGMPLEQLAKISQPFQTTKERGSGIGLCHTRSILTVHGGNCGFIVNWAWGPASKLFCRVYLCDGF
jgi:signal transduction histidine kinase